MIDSSLALPPVSAELYSISADLHPLAPPVPQQLGLWSHCSRKQNKHYLLWLYSHVVCVNKERPGIFLYEQKQADFWLEFI